MNRSGFSRTRGLAVVEEDEDEDEDDDVNRRLVGILGALRDAVLVAAVEESELRKAAVPELGNWRRQMGETWGSRKRGMEVDDAILVVMVLRRQ